MVRLDKWAMHKTKLNSLPRSNKIRNDFLSGSLNNLNSQAAFFAFFSVRCFWQSVGEKSS